MMRRLCNIFISGILLLAIAADSSFIQLVAWSTMLPARIIEKGSLAKGVESTFGGDEPCPLCSLAEQKSESENAIDPSQLKEREKLEPKITGRKHLEALQPRELLTSLTYLRESHLPAIHRVDTPELPPPISCYTI